MMTKSANLFPKTMAFTLILMASVTSYAQTLIGGIYYNLDDTKKEAEVTNKSSVSDRIHYSGNMNIPKSVKSGNVTYTVTSISDETFFQANNLISLSIPSTVKRIGVSTFPACTNLKSITVDKDNKVFDSRNNCNAVIHTETNELLFGCKNTVIPSTVTRIADYAFFQVDMSSIVIPNTVTSIGSMAFFNCTNFVSVTLPESLVSVEKMAFCGCMSLESVVIPNTVTYIEDVAFASCHSLKSVTLSNNLENIGEMAFTSCDALETITIPASVTEIGENAFEGCSSLRSITFLSTTPPKIGKGAFDEGASIEIHVPKGYKSVYENNPMFEHCNIIDDMPVPATSGIEGFDGNSEIEVDKVYTISGQRVAKLEKGLYIVNGKKYIVK